MKLVREKASTQRIHEELEALKREAARRRNFDASLESVTYSLRLRYQPECNPTKPYNIFVYSRQERATIQGRFRPTKDEVELDIKLVRELVKDPGVSLKRIHQALVSRGHPLQPLQSVLRSCQDS